MRPGSSFRDAWTVKARVGQHSVRGRHPALIQNSTKGDARTVEGAVQGSLGDVEVSGNHRGRQTWLTVALPDDFVDTFAQRVAMSFGLRAGIFLSER